MKTFSVVVLFVMGCLYLEKVNAGVVVIGNSDEGGDLENLAPVTSGPIQDAKFAAIELLKKVNVSGVPSLGNLIPEIEKSEMFIAEKDVKASIQDDYRPDHLSTNGFVYARTVPEPYAPTRFFPVAQRLTKDQLIKLHIHEGLHRALPEEYRTDESIVAQITLAITSPDTSFDQVASVSRKLLKTSVKEAVSFKEDLYPSFLGYSLRQLNGADENDGFDVSRTHTIKSYLYPFGTDDSSLGMGIEFSLIERDNDIQSGPLGLSFRWKALTARKFDFDLFGSVSLNTLSFQEIRRSPYGRDIYELGISMRRSIKSFYIENSISLRNGGESVQTIGLVNYTYKFGNVVEPAIHFGYIWENFHFGSYLNFFLSDNFEIFSGNNSFLNTGRFRVVTIGPEVSYKIKEFSVGVSGRYIVDSTKDADLSYLGTLDSWVGRGGLEFNIGYRF